MDSGADLQHVVNWHNDAVHPLHKLAFLASIGVRQETLQPAPDAILSQQPPEGPFQVRIVIPKVFGGDGVPRWDWVATDAPLVLYALLRLGIRSPEAVRGVDALVSHTRDGGYPCFASRARGSFRGPGSRGDPCPYANLIMLRMLAQIPERSETPEAEVAEVLADQLDPQGRVTANSAWLKWKGWEFCQKREPSRWLTFLVHRALNRLR